MKQITKWLEAIVLAASLLAGSAVRAQAADAPIAEPAQDRFALPVFDRAAKVTEQVIQEQNDLYKADIHIPVIQGFKDAKYQRELNRTIYETAMKDFGTIKEQAAQDAAMAKQQGYPYHPYEIAINYGLKSNGSEKNKNRFSLSVSTYTYTGGAHGMTRVDNFNALNSLPASRITLETLFGPDYKKKIDGIIQHEIDTHPESYFPNTKIDIGPNQSFYIENGNAVVQFALYEIAPYAYGMPEFPIPIPGRSS